LRRRRLTILLGKMPSPAEFRRQSCSIQWFVSCDESIV
jgi:hypothetical protein